MHKQRGDISIYPWWRGDPDKLRIFFFFFFFLSCLSVHWSSKCSQVENFVLFFRMNDGDIGLGDPLPRCLAINSLNVAAILCHC